MSIFYGWPCFPLGYNSPAPPTATCPNLHFPFTQIQIADVLKELQNLDPYKSAGLDNLDPLFLKLSAEIAATPITSLFNLSFVSSEILIDWNAVAVIPFLKGGDTPDPNCYRPISILPCLSKIFESQVPRPFRIPPYLLRYAIWFQSWSWVHLSHPQGPKRHHNHNR